MSRNISVISALPTFGTLRQNLNQSDYITRKKGLKTFCTNPSICNNNIYKSYNDLNSYNWGKYTQSLNKCPQIPINKANMVLNKYSTYNLNDVCSIIEGNPCSTSINCVNNCPPIPINISTTVPFYETYTIDPNGALFGTNQCGTLNYTHFLKFNNIGPNFVNYNKIT